jgi:benzoate-CoA ligase
MSASQKPQSVDVPGGAPVAPAATNGQGRGLSPRFNFARHLLEENARRAAKVAYIDDAGRLTYGELSERMRRFAASLRALGLRREERVLLLMLDTNDWPVAFLGSLYAGVVPVAVNTLLSADEYAYMLEHSRARAAIVSAPLLETLRAAMGKAAHQIETVVISRGHTFDGTLDLEELIGRSEAMEAPAETAGDEPGFWLYSSGSTGRPKGTVHTHANLYWTAELYGKGVLGLREDDLCFSASKLFFAYGLGNALTFPLSVGATVLLMAERATPDAIFKRWIAHRPTVFYFAPTGYAALLASPALPVRGDVALRLCSSAGEALPRELGERFTRHFGCSIIDGIGSTEMLHIFISNRPDDLRYGTSGKPVGGYRAELRDDHGRVITAPNEVGDLYVQGPSSALMYWSDRQRSRETFQGGWTRTGDKYVLDDDGYYVYTGRTDDMLRVSGQYVSPFEVETALMEHPAVLEAAVIGVLDGDGLTRPKACVVLKDAGSAGDALADELKQFVKSRLAPYKYPRFVEFLPELPKTATGKIQRVRLREREVGVK